jgi:hypothetical protein
MKTGITLTLSALTALGGTGLLSSFHMPFVSDGYSPPAECVQWYDGCNMCQKEIGDVAVCSARVCASPGKGFCREYATSTARS